jgi:hypothetical protein
LLLENSYLACVLLKIMNNINVDFYDTSGLCPGAYNDVKTALPIHQSKQFIGPCTFRENKKNSRQLFPAKFQSIHMKFSMTGQEKSDLLIEEVTA